MTIRTRFAPSPTGVLHLGSVRTALFSWLYARHNGGEFLLRIEDTDRERSTPENVEAIFDGMAWLNLDSDEKPTYQTERFDRYREVTDQWLKEGKAYHCYCTRDELDAMREQQMATGGHVGYDGRCRDRHEPREGVDPVVRFRNPDEGAVTVTDQFSRSYTIPGNGHHPNFQLRFRMISGSGVTWDFWHVDDVCFAQNPDPILQITKLSSVLSDPVNGTTGPKAIPGAFIQYTIGVSNQGIGTVDVDSLQVSDPLPANTAVYVSTVSGDPISFIDGSPASGLSYDYAANVSYSDRPGGGAPYNYTPVPDAQGFDPLVTGFLVEPTGVMNGDLGSGPPSFNVILRIRIE